MQVGQLWSAVADRVEQGRRPTVPKWEAGRVYSDLRRYMSLVVLPDCQSREPLPFSLLLRYE